jgi:predicted nucleic acid-binding protein
LKLISSEALLFENRRNPNEVRKMYASEVLNTSNIFVKFSVEIEKRANEFVREGIDLLDALHLASAEHGQADYFCTCDDNPLKRATAVTVLGTKVVSPITLLQEITQ